MDNFIRINIIWDRRCNINIQLILYGTAISIILRRDHINSSLKITIIICIWGYISW